MDLYTADVSKVTARHRRRTEVAEFNQQQESMARDRTAFMSETDTAYDTLAEERKEDDTISKATAFATAGGSVKALAIDLGSGQIKGGYKATDAKILEGASKGFFGSGETIQARRATRLAKNTRQLPGAVVKLGGAPTTTRVGGVKLASAAENPAAHSVSRVAEHEASTLAAKSLNPVIKESGKAALKGGEKAGAKAIGKSFAKQLGPAANIGFAADVTYDLVKGDKKLSQESKLEETSDITQLISGAAEVGSLGVGAAIGLGLIGVGAAPLVAGLAVVGAVAGAASAVAGGIDAYDKLKDEESVAEEEKKEVETKYDTENPTKPLQSLGDANLIQGKLAPKLR